jgi:hypothetical protein
MWESGKSVTDVLKGNEEMLKSDPSLVNAEVIED